LGGAGGSLPAPVIAGTSPAWRLLMDKRVNVNFSESAYKTLETLAEEKGETMAEVLRDALSLEKFVWDVTQKEKGRILVERNGAVQELLIR
jgi:hypothetical protein